MTSKSKVFSVRLPIEQAARVEEIAERLGARPPSVLKAAVESYLDECERGLPESLPAPRPTGRPRNASQTAAGGVAPVPYSDAQRARIEELWSKVTVTRRP